MQSERVTAWSRLRPKAQLQGHKDAVISRTTIVATKRPATLAVVPQIFTRRAGVGGGAILQLLDERKQQPRYRTTGHIGQTFSDTEHRPMVPGTNITASTMRCEC